MARKFSPQVNSAWRLAVVTMIWIIWDQRNKCIFDGAMVSTSRTLAQFWAYMREANDSHLGCMHNDVFDLMVLSTFNIVGRPSKVPTIHCIKWQLPPLQYIKINVDGGACFRGSRSRHMWRHLLR
ncbi:hypothetical protein ACS0TY_023695 [Phlomoides rotata]